jgi:hypothetical protein
MVLLCDVDHGLVHDRDLAVGRRSGRLVVTTPDGQRVWGAADTAFTGTALRFHGTDPEGEAPLDELIPSPAGGGERMDLQHAVWALMAHRDGVRRRAA